MSSEFLQNFPKLGEILSSGSAIVWALAIILFRISGKHIHALGLNLFKVIISGFLIASTMLILGKPFLFPSSLKNWGLLLSSGIIGIGVADTLLFSSLNRLGAGLSAVVNCSYSPFVIFLSFLFIGERMSGLQLFGVLLIISAVLTLYQKKINADIPQKDLAAGILLGTLSMFFMAVGIVMMKPVLNQSPLLWATLVRIAGGAVVLIPVVAFHRERRHIRAQMFSIKNWKPMVGGSVLGGFFSLLAWMGGMKYTLASQASALNQLNTIFIFVFGVFLLKEPVTKFRIFALFLGFVGALLVTFKI